MYDADGSPIGMQYRNTSYADGVFDIYWYEKKIYKAIRLNMNTDTPNNWHRPICLHILQPLRFRHCFVLFWAGAAGNNYYNTPWERMADKMGGVTNADIQNSYRPNKTYASWSEPLADAYYWAQKNMSFFTGGLIYVFK